VLKAAVRDFGFGGFRPHRIDQPVPVSSVIDVSLRHGDLAYARHAVLVGHYLGDTIVSAEAALDQRLRGALTRRRDLGLYPGPSGSPSTNHRTNSAIHTIVMIAT